MAEPQPDLQREVEQFLFREARLLDGGRFEDWLALFAPDGVYWVPATQGQTDPLNVPSIVYENRSLLAMRVKRLAHPHAHMLSPPPRTVHLVGNVEVEPAGDGECRVGSVLVMTEHRDEQRRVFSGRCTHVLRRINRDWRIALKRVDLVDCDGIASAMMIPF